MNKNLTLFQYLDREPVQPQLCSCRSIQEQDLTVLCCLKTKTKFIYCLFGFQEWQKRGRKVYELIEPVDGFHPRLKAEELAAKTLWQVLESKIPHVLGKVNPNNFLIEAVFGDQGGY